MSLGATIIAVAVLLWLTAQYWLAPIVTRLGHRIKPMGPILEPVRAGSETEIDPLVRAVLDSYGSALEALGFAPTPLLVNKGQLNRGFVQLFEHPRHGDVASVLVVPDPTHPEPHTLVGFTSLVGGLRLRTANSPLPSVFPSPPYGRMARFPDERGPARLYALHRVRVRRCGQQSSPIRVGDPVAFQRREEEDGPRNWLARGYVFRDGAELRPTWKGALCMPYRLLFPWKQLNEWRDESLRRRLLPDAGLA